MNEDRTRNLPDGASFEERVFARFDAMDARLDGIEGRLTTLEEKVDRRLQETRPIWEAVKAQLSSLEIKVTDIGVKVESIDEKMDVLALDLLELRGSQRSLNKRVTKLEDMQPPQQ
ncbi:MAG: hypothetical protein ACRD68_05205 [Pyrinomonadaceae bacterium]